MRDDGGLVGDVAVPGHDLRVGPRRVRQYLQSVEHPLQCRTVVQIDVVIADRAEAEYDPKSKIETTSELGISDLGFGFWDLGFGIYRKANGRRAASTGNIDLL